MPPTVVHLDKLCKQYQLGATASAGRSLREAIYATVGRCVKSLGKQNRRDNQTFHALTDVSFHVPQGQVLGLIGHNGAGKSTLLKILSRITDPTTGVARVKGRVGSLLEVGTGFHPELTGRENIYLNGAILGMTRKQIRDQFDAIVDFAGVDRFVDTPVKRYSSGMYVRLAFAVAAHLEPEVLLVDEVLAVGDAVFQKKCLGKMSDVAKSGRTVLFVSHQMAAVESLCQRVIVLDKGAVAYDGPTAGGIDHYLAGLETLSCVPLQNRHDREGDGRIRLTDYHLESPTRGRTDTARCGEPINLIIDYNAHSKSPLQDVQVSAQVNNHTGQHVFTCSTRFTGQNFQNIPQQGRFVLNFPKLALTPGQYGVHLHVQIGGYMADYIKTAAWLDIVQGDFYGTGHLPPEDHHGSIVEHDWQVQSVAGKAAA